MFYEILLKFHQKKLACLQSDVELIPIPPPKSNILLAPKEYVDYWIYMMCAAFKDKPNTKQIWNELRTWQCNIFGFYLISDSLMLLHNNNIFHMEYLRETLGFYLLMYTLEPTKFKFHDIVNRIYTANPTDFLKKFENCSSGDEIYRSLAIGYPDIFFTFGIDTFNEQVVDITAPLVKKINIRHTYFARMAYVKLVLNKFPIENIPDFKNEHFLSVLVQFSPAKMIIGNCYDVSFLTVKNIHNFMSSIVLSNHVKLFLSVHFERYKYVLMFSFLYWLLLILIPSLMITLLVFFQLDAILMIIFRLITFIVYFCAFRLYYKFSVLIWIPIVINIFSIYCSVLIIDQVLLEIFFLFYNFYWYYKFICYAENTLIFLKNSKKSGCLILNFGKINYIHISVNGNVSVSENRIDYCLIKKCDFIV